MPLSLTTYTPREAREPDREAPHEPTLNDRQKWILAEHLAGRRPGHKNIREADNCSRVTAAHDLKTLKSLALIHAPLGGVTKPLPT